MTGDLPERVIWDGDGSYEAALLKIIGAVRRNRGCRLTAAMVQALAFSEGDGEYFNALRARAQESGHG